MHDQPTQQSRANRQRTARALLARASRMNVPKKGPSLAGKLERAAEALLTARR